MLIIGEAGGGRKFQSQRIDFDSAQHSGKLEKDGKSNDDLYWALQIIYCALIFETNPPIKQKLFLLVTE